MTIKIVTLMADEHEMIITALNMRRNYIETGNVTTSAQDASKFKDIKVNALTTEQMRLIIKTEELIDKILSS